MALLTDATDTWATPILLNQDEIWQARSGSVYLSTTSNPAADDGFLLMQGQAVRFSAGRSVQYRSTPGAAQSTIAREDI